MKWKLTLLTLVSVLLLGWGSPAEAKQKSFTDVKASFWAKEEIDYLVEKEIINGYPDGRFGINDPISRAQAATMIMRYFGWGSSGPWEDPGYSDLKPGSHWAYNDIAALYHLDIFKPNGKYQPELAVTRGEMAEMLVNTFDLTSIKASKFTDLTYDHNAYHAINVLAGNQITSGYPDGTYRPDAPVSRAEFAVFMSRAMDQRFRLTDTTPSEIIGRIFNVEIGGQYYQLEEPLLLTNKWHAPVEMFEIAGYYPEVLAEGKLTLTSSDGKNIELQNGQPKIWVGETSVEITDPITLIDGKYYIAASGIFAALEKPLVFYPDDLIVRLEAPRITAADIIRQMPESAIRVIHNDQPYWHWVKRDSDYLELIKKNGSVESKREQLLQEMEELTKAFFQVSQEKFTYKGITYYSDNITGKLDAISRGLEARYSLLYDHANYSYPAPGASGGLGTFSTRSNSRYEFSYTVYDHSFDHFEQNKQALINELKSFSAFDLEIFDGLSIHGIPFSIRENNEDGSFSNWSGLARGAYDMLVVNSQVGTFYHELGHNWDSMLGDHDEYLKLRGKTGYVPQSNDWANRVQENFAEDFRVVLMPERYGEYHKGVFEMPTASEIKALQDWIVERSKATKQYSHEKLLINGESLLPDALLLNDGKIHVQGTAGHNLFGSFVNLTTGEETLIDFTANGQSFDQTVMLPEKGHYKVNIGSVLMHIVYN